ncbi:MAG: galactokinase GalK, partial [Porphyrobacter sp. HL-46]
DRGKLDATLHARARHVVSEIARVEPVAAALASGNSAALARLLAEGHRSLAEDFAVSLPSLDRLAAAVQSALGDAGGVRLTGAGFGGCLVAVGDAAAAPAISAAVEGYNRAADPPARIEAFRPASGAARILLGR